MKLFSRRPAPAEEAVHMAAPRDVSMAVETRPGEALDYSLYAVAGPQYTHDEIVQKIGLKAYRDMLRDSTVSSSVRRRVVTMFPGYQIVARDDSPAGIRAGEVVSAIVERMPGSFLQTVRAILTEGSIMGFAVLEPVWSALSVPGIGALRGLAALKVRPSETFEGGIITDRHGNLTAIRQVTSGVTVTPEEVLLYIHEPQPGLVGGTSILYSAYDPWLMRRDMERNWDMYLRRLAGGLAIVKAPEKALAPMQQRLLDILKRLQTATNIVLPSEASIELRETSGVGGQLFNTAGAYFAGKIRAAILGSEDVNARVATGTYGRARVEQESVGAEIQAAGQAFADWFAEDLFNRLLAANGYAGAPVPLLLPEPKTAPDVDPIPILDAIGRAQQIGTITLALPESTQLQLINTALQRAGAAPIKPGEAETIERPAPVQPSGSPVDPGPSAPAALAAAPAADRRMKLAAGAGRRPAGRTVADLLRIKREWIADEEAGALRVREAWRGLVPGVVETINDGLWNKDGSQKLTDWLAIRQLVETATGKGGQKLTAAFLTAADKRFQAGLRDAWAMMPASAQARVKSVVKKAVDEAQRVKAGAVVGGPNISPAAVAEALRNDVYISLARFYGDLQSSVYYTLRDGVMSGASARDIMENLYAECDGAMTEGRAQTLVNTTLARAYEEARHSVFCEIESADPATTEPGVIIGYESVAILDDATTPECEARAGLFFTPAEAAADPIPRHYNCRSVYVPLFSGEEPWTDRGWWDGSSLPTPGFQQKGA